MSDKGLRADLQGRDGLLVNDWTPTTAHEIYSFPGS